MSDIKRYALVLVAVLLLAVLPLALARPSGAASAGLSAGFLSIMDHPLRLLLVLPVGVLAGYLRGDERVVFPLGFFLMYLIGALLEVDFSLYPMTRLFILGAILVFGLALSVATSRVFLASTFIAGSVAYHLGGYGMHALPLLASPLFFLIGQLLALVLALAISFSVGIIIMQGTAPKLPGVSTRLPDPR